MNYPVEAHGDHGPADGSAGAQGNVLKDVARRGTAGAGPVVPTSEMAPEQLRCPRCGYIVVGLPDTRCPECGSEFDWPTVLELARWGPRLPIERTRGWRRIGGAVQTWLLVLFRPWVFARFSAHSSIWPATVFAAACMAIGLLGNAIAGLARLNTREQVGWVIAVWFHVECQSLVFCVLDVRLRGWLVPWNEGGCTLTRRLGRWLRRFSEQWSFWRKVSLYTTAFVALDWAGPPMLEDLIRGGNFPWVLRPESWWRNLGLDEVLRGVAYYWWMGVLLITLWLRLRRKWCILIILALMPLITMASCRVAVEVTGMM